MYRILLAGFLLLLPVLTACVSPAPATVMVYFTDANRFALGTPPFEAGVSRTVAASARLPEAVLAEFFKGPTEAEKARGLEAVLSGFTGFSQLRMESGVASLYLTGECRSNGATYTIAQPLMKNLLQFPEIQWVKIFDQDGSTEEPDGLTHSIPFCLEP